MGSTVKETFTNCKLQEKIVISWFEKIRDYCHHNLLMAKPMGGANFNIQIDESLFRGRRKYNRGRLKPGDIKPKEYVVEKLKSIINNNITNRNYGNRVEGPWVFGMVLQNKNQIKISEDIKKFNDKIRKKFIEKTKQKSIRTKLYQDKRKINTKENRIYNTLNSRKFVNGLIKKADHVVKEVRMFVVPKRDTSNLLPIIVNNCNIGSEVVSDEWRAYRRLKQYGFKHYTVNHTKNFVDPKSKKHTQLIECLWNIGKSTIIKRLAL